MTKTDIIRRYLAHLGIILCHLSIAGVFFIIGSFLSIILSIAAFLLSIVLILITVGLIFALVPNYWDKVVATADALKNISETSASLVPTVAIITAILCVASIVLTALDVKWEKAKARLITSSVMVGVVIFLVVAILVGIIGGAA